MLELEQAQSSYFTQRETEAQSLISASWLVDPVKVCVRVGRGVAYGRSMIRESKLCSYSHSNILKLDYYLANQTCLVLLEIILKLYVIYWLNEIYRYACRLLIAC